jgi:23S rRNA pseudouridine1911/1915/1917 synthase
MGAEFVRLLDHLRRKGLQGRALRKALETGKVRVHDVPTADGGRWVDPKSVRIWAQAPRLVVGRDPALIFKDSHLAVVWKPANWLSVAAPRRGQENNLVSWAARLLGRALPVHRLDEGTSGLMLVARTPQAQVATKGLFARHEIDRRYLALVNGTFQSEPLVHRSALVRDRGDGRRGSGQGPDAKSAETHFSLKMVLVQRASLVEAVLQTGRTHQVRIHLAELGHAVLGDALYARKGVARRCRRLALHAAVLGFRHPMTGKKLRFEAPLADDLERLRRHLAAPAER